MKNRCQKLRTWHQTPEAAGGSAKQPFPKEYVSSSLRLIGLPQRLKDCLIDRLSRQRRDRITDLPYHRGPIADEHKIWKASADP